MGIVKEFKQFAVRGNLMDLTIGFVIGTAFSKVVSSLVNDIVMPPIGWLVGRVDFSNLYINLSSTHYKSFAAAQAAGAPTINIGMFLNNVLNFVVVAIIMFLVVQQLNRLHKKSQQAEPAPVTTKTCPYCQSAIPLMAIRCPACTSSLEQEI